MKKIFIVAVCAFGFLNASAEDILQVKPVQVVANLEENDWEESFDVELVNTKEFTAFQFDLYLPEGMTLIEDGPMDLSEDRFEGKIVKKQWVPNATSSVDSKGDGHYLVTLYHENLEKIKGNSGTLLKFYYLTDPSMKPGYYPVVIKNIVLTVTATDDVQIPSTSSYIVVEGEPEATSLTFEGVVPSFVNTALAAETGISKLDLSAVTEVNGTFTYVDGREVVKPTADVTANVAYKRSVATGSYASVCLPFDASLSCYTYSETSGDYAIFSPATSLSADTPAIVNGNIDVTAEGVTLGNATKQTKNTGYYLKDGSFCKVNGTATIPALRGWWDLDTPSSNLRLMIDGTLTDINLLDVDAAEADAYDLQGRRSASAKNGVYVVNGKKQLVK